MEDYDKNGQFWGLVFPECSGYVGEVGCFRCLRALLTGSGKDRTAGGPLWFLVLLFIFVWAGPSYRVAHWRAVLATACRCVEGYRTPDEALVCRGRGANGCELKPSSGMEIVCGLAPR